MNRFAPYAALAALALAAGLATAEPMTFQVDRGHSEVGFNVRHIFNQVHGRFNDYDAAITYDPKDVANSSVSATIRDSSIFTGVERRDAHLRTNDFFWADKYPTITFKSTKVVPGKDDKHFAVQGNLTIRDVTKPVTLDTQFLGMGPVSINGHAIGTQAGFIAKTTVNRKDYGIVWNRALDQGGMMLDDDVELVLNIAAMAPPSGAAAAAAKK